MNALQRFNESISSDLLNENSNYSQRMYLIDVMFYSDAKKLGDVDFSTFSASDLKDTIDDILQYESDESSDFMEEGTNMGNPIYEINSLAGITKNILDIQPQQKKKRRFI